MPGSPVRSQRGYTLVEMLLVVALVGIIGAAATMTISQLMTGTILCNDQNSAINQVRNADQWIRRDAQTAKSIDDNPAAPKFLEMTVWENADGTASHTVTYSYVDSSGGLKDLHRDSGTQQIMVAQYIDPASTSCSWDSVERVLTVTITAHLGDKTETRTIEVKARPDPA